MKKKPTLKGEGNMSKTIKQEKQYQIIETVGGFYMVLLIEPNGTMLAYEQKHETRTDAVNMIKHLVRLDENTEGRTKEENNPTA